MRLGLSHLNENKFNHNFKDCVNTLGSSNLQVESIPHFFLHCHYFTDIRETLFHELQWVDKNSLNQYDNEIAELLLYGRSNFKLQQNSSKIFHQIHHKIWKIQWFNGTLNCITHLYFCLFFQSQICILIIAPHSN